MEIGPFAGLIYTVILIVDCLFFLILEWSMPREDLDFVRMHWDQEYFVKVCMYFFLRRHVCNLRCSCTARRKEGEEMIPTPKFRCIVAEALFDPTCVIRPQQTREPLRHRNWH